MGGYRPVPMVLELMLYRIQRLQEPLYASLPCDGLPSEDLPYHRPCCRRRELLFSLMFLKCGGK